jgi:hypothetical protein
MPGHRLVFTLHAAASSVIYAITARWWATGAAAQGTKGRDTIEGSKGDQTKDGQSTREVQSGNLAQGTRNH